MTTLYYVRCEGITYAVPFHSAREASVWALRTVNEVAGPIGKFLPFKILRVQAQGVH